MNVPPDFGYAIAVIDKSVRGSEVSSVARERVAVHASAHAVVALLNGITIERVTLRQAANGDWIGRTDWRHPSLAEASAGLPRRLQRRAHLQLLRAYIAGRGAELKQGFGWPGETFTLDYAAPDTEQSLALAELICPRNPGRVILGAVHFVHDFILDPVAAAGIERLGEELAAVHEMSGPEVKELLRVVFEEEMQARQTENDT